MLSSLISQALACCCIRTRARSSERQGGPDEHTHLIPPTNEVPSIRTYVVDQQKMKERLGTIVRAKEGKMVNVNAPLPFNLHNRPLHTLDPSATRSRSVSANASAYPSGPSHPHHRFPSYSPVRDESPSLQTSRSTSSLHPGDASYLPPEADPESGVRKPAFSVRLVRATGPGLWTRRGRSVTRGRFSRLGEEMSRGRQNGESMGWDGAAEVLGEGDGAGNGVQANGNAGPDVGETGLAESPAGDGLATPVSKAHPPIEPVAGSDDPGGEDSGDDGSATPNFHIQDVGKISQSWGD